jgi:acetyl esterase/lipase
VRRAVVIPASVAALTVALGLAACGHRHHGAGAGAAPVGQVTRVGSVRRARDASRYRIALTRDRFPADVRVRTYGHGVQDAIVLSPRRGDGVARPAVLFLHGWLATNPRYYLPWLVHLVREGNVVIHPNYQDPHTLPSYFLENVLAGVREALARTAIVPGTLVTVGHSAGGTLAADYAAVACREGLPPAQAVMAVFPADRLREFPEAIPRRAWEQIPGRVPVIALAGSHDRIVGDTEAIRIANAAPFGRLERLTTPGVDTHLAAQNDTPPVRTELWGRLDTLIRRARTRTPVTCG